MSKIAVVFWSGTGNTEAMANSVVEGIKAVGVDVELFQVDDFSADKMEFAQLMKTIISAAIISQVRIMFCRLRELQNFIPC